MVDDNSDRKTPIELSVGTVKSLEPATRSVITDAATGKPVAPGTHIYMVMKSEYVALPDPNGFGGNQTTKYSVTRGQVAESTDPDKNDIVFTDTRVRYWDDIHARCSNLSIWAIACPGLNYLGGIGTNQSDNTVKFTSTTGLQDWQTTAIKADAIEWNVPHYGTSETYYTAGSIANRDLCYSNNIADYTSSSNGDRRLKFNQANRKFQGGNLVFYHAMSKITVNIKIGEGFNGVNDFRFTETAGNKNATLQYFNIWGKFNVETGEWSVVNDGHQAIMGMHNLTGATPNISDPSKPAYQLEALVIPYLATDVKTIKGSIINGESNKAVVFTIDNNKYEVSRADLLKALQDKADNGISGVATSVELQAGKNYVFTFEVGKTKIKNITAQVVDWEDVTAENVTPSNARITLNVEDRSGNSSISAVTSDMDIYRTLDEASTITDTYEGYNWTTNYTVSGKATWKNLTLAYDGTNSRWSTDWFWESNKTYYHFRTISPKTQEVYANASGDYTTINSASCSNEAGYNQMAWGAPFLDVDPDYKFTYSTTTGFDGTGADAATPTHQIYKAIGPTENPVKVLMFHMMSGVHFTIKTTDGTDKVQLYSTTGSKRTKIELVNYYPDGKVMLGTGLVNKDGTISTEGSPYGISCATTATDEYGNQEYFFSAIPQDLTNVVLVITTPDNNQYKVAMKNVLATSVTNNNIANPYTQDGSKWKIDYWYPGFKYNYSFTLKKTGITDLQATVVDWETVTAGDDDVKIE